MAGFYSDIHETGLLLGDIVTGFRAVVPKLHEPHAAGAEVELGIFVTQPEYFAVTTPCCAVDNGRVSLAPLVHIDPQWMINPYLAEDLTRMNRRASGENFWPPKRRENATVEELQEMVDRGPIYGFRDRFIYEPHDLLHPYKLKNLPEPTRHWLLDFGAAFRIDCNKIARNAAPPGVKLLQLSVAARHELRQKMESYYGEIPAEDRALLGALI